MTDFSRTETLIGSEAQKRLQSATVCIAGLGGVGSYAVEALARSGIGSFILIDFDTIGPSNLNRQLLATLDSIGKPKTELMQARILQINAEAQITNHQVFLDSENRAELTAGADFVIDAIDSLGPKIGLLEDLAKRKARFISIMGAGNRLDPTQIHLDKISKSHNCPLARRVRKFLRRRGVKLDFPCVYSSELALIPDEDLSSDEELTIERGRKRQIIGSISYMPAIMGMMAASWVINSIIREK
ncbi:MAG: tRNA threonylcarbamoyladenosine dehydratase [Candidatus Cloacimonadaceae bacterium]|jgi:tRNA A37 threonylcarbamoyladenosine dehydratase|nr:tRNA threonylcarbamoyladenosine dehydratase [Candidatus Cloacimonadota bacterium]MDY0127793.1 tRNA threonylcarbamoyladenosine dehydratase [Candidatus Cloacimonadaceae bacterium]MCB5255462.1 tRNA threonylcarbamoyladenosine dehydratase [Candidatus Cloacimonadota bacterium]MCK9178657.1 tRNA threonylcarbamoyladenosine dehydratase [Candidatus Cloacimonadota bacterium]MCK9242819.1 tRNA threonylcarbamoyladenosine dehydratase [Candidatus Cloacimonadota bacterium]